MSIIAYETLNVVFLMSLQALKRSLAQKAAFLFQYAQEGFSC